MKKTTMMKALLLLFICVMQCKAQSKLVIISSYSSSVLTILSSSGNTDPIFERPSYQFEVEEEAPAGSIVYSHVVLIPDDNHVSFPGTSIGRVVATDNEQPNDLTYSIVAASEVASLLSINSSTGLIRTATVINREVKTTFIIIIILSSMCNYRLAP